MVSSPAPSVTQSASFYFGEGASRDQQKALIADAISCTAGLLAAAAGILAAGSWRGRWEPGAKLLYSTIIPFWAGAALLTSLTVLVRTIVRTIETEVLERHRLRRFPRFGRKGLLVSTSSVLFVASCFYRALNVADEGAALCRSRPSVFNMPAAGRAVATVGEIALVVQISTYISDTASRLGILGDLWAARRRFTLVPVILAENFSWAGLLTGVPRFFCCEYVMWCLIAATWCWDAAELTHQSARRGDSLMHAGLLVGALALLAFNALFEIPHFFRYSRSGAPTEIAGIFECLQDADSPIWLKRLPFFFCYFFGAAWSSMALSFRYLHRGRVAPPELPPSAPPLPAHAPAPTPADAPAPTTGPGQRVTRSTREKTLQQISPMRRRLATSPSRARPKNSS